MELVSTSWAESRLFPDRDNVNNVLPRDKGQACLLASLCRSFLSSVFLGSGTTHCMYSIHLVSPPHGLHGTWGARGVDTYRKLMLPVVPWVIDYINLSGLLISLPTESMRLFRADLTAVSCCFGVAWQYHLLLHPIILLTSLPCAEPDF